MIVPGMNATSESHLEMIQAVVARLAQNSFALKGWSVTLVAACLALGAKERSTKSRTRGASMRLVRELLAFSSSASEDLLEENP